MSDSHRRPLPLIVFLSLAWILVPVAAVAGAEETSEANGAGADADLSEGNEAPASDAAGEAEGGDDEAPATEGEAAPADAPAHDRIILTNGEIHDGTFQGLRDGSYRLNSEGFGTIAVEPEQVERVELAEPRLMHVKTGKRESAVEVRFVSRDGELWLEPFEAQPEPFVPGDYMLVQVEPIPDAVWSFRAQATMTFTAGNSETFGSGLFTRLRRTTDFDNLTFEYEFGYQESRSAAASVTERFHRGQVGYRYFFQSWWGAFARSTLRSNLLAGIQLQNANELGLSANPGLPDDLDLTFDLGVTFTYRDRVGQESELYGGASAALQLTWSASESLELLFYNGFDLSFDDTDNWNNVTRLSGDFKVTDIFSAGFVAEMSYANQPAANFRNTDFRLVATLGISL